MADVKDQHTVRFGSRTRERLDAAARRAGISVSEYVRRATDAALDADDDRERAARVDLELADARRRIAALERAAGGRR